MNLIEELLASKNDLDGFANKIPCLLHINKVDDFSIVYLDPQLRTYIQDRHGKGFEHFKTSLAIVHPDDLEKAKTSCRYYLEHIDEFSTVSFVQRVKLLNENSYSTLYTTSLLIEELGGLVSFSVLLDSMTINNRSIDTIVNETNYVKANFNKLKQLTDKEINFIKLWVKNLSSDEISETLKITTNTVKTYKKRIYKKLEIQNFKSLLEFSIAFELIDN